eukprot:1146088-Pelagomonas_calceolata.AAC.9
MNRRKYKKLQNFRAEAVLSTKSGTDALSAIQAAQTGAGTPANAKASSRAAAANSGDEHLPASNAASHLAAYVEAQDPQEVNTFPLPDPCAVPLDLSPDLCPVFPHPFPSSLCTLMVGCLHGEASSPRGEAA